MRNRLFKTTLALGLALLVGGALGLNTGYAQGGSKNAQSIMVSATTENTAYQIEGTITWTYARGTHNEPGTAMTYYANTRTGGPSYAACGGSGTNCAAGNAPTAATIAAAEPPANTVKLQQHAQAQRCTFFFGGALTGDTYEQQATVPGANGKGNWVYTWTYTIAPNPDTAVVAQRTAWSSEETGGSVDVNFSGFIAGESFQAQSSRNKYSFTMLENGLSRARGVTAQLQVSDGNGGWTSVGDLVSLDNADSDLDTINDSLAVVPAASNFSYLANGGVFGSSNVLNALHYASGKPANSISNILNGISDSSPADNFAGNNNDLAAGNVHTAPFGNTFSGITEEGTYRILISGSIKGNGGAADVSFSVSSSQVTIGGCTLPVAP